MRQTIAFVGIEFDSRLSQRLQTTSMAVWVEKLKVNLITTPQHFAMNGAKGIFIFYIICLLELDFCNFSKVLKSHLQHLKNGCNESI